VLPREAQLLLATAGGPDQDDRIGELARSPIDWTLLLQLTALERAEAVVAGRLARLEVPLPADVSRQLKAMAVRSDLRMATISHRLDRTLEALAAAGVEPLLLKGAALGRTVYGSLARRPMLDVDLLVRPEDAAVAHQTALGAGWMTIELDPSNDHYAGHFHLPPLSDGMGFGFNLELHTALFVSGHPFNWSLEDLWSRSRKLPSGTGRVPAPEDILLHTVLHFCWSHMARVGPWRTFRDNGVPPEVEEGLRPRSSERINSALERHLAGQWYLLDAPCPSVGLERVLWKLAMGPLGRSRGKAMPWARELVFPDLWNSGPVESSPGRLFRHLVNAGWYLRYFRRVLLGAPSRRIAPGPAR
jgi:hypothetical protein